MIDSQEVKHVHTEIDMQEVQEGFKLADEYYDDPDATYTITERVLRTLTNYNQRRQINDSDQKSRYQICK